MFLFVIPLMLGKNIFFHESIVKTSRPEEILPAVLSRDDREKGNITPVIIRSGYCSPPEAGTMMPADIELRSSGMRLKTRL